MRCVATYVHWRMLLYAEQIHYGNVSPLQKLETEKKNQSISNIISSSSMSVHLCNNNETQSTILIGLETMDSEIKWKKEIEKVNARKKVGQKTNFIVTAVTVVALFSHLRSLAVSLGLKNQIEILPVFLPRPILSKSNTNKRKTLTKTSRLMKWSIYTICGRIVMWIYSKSIVFLRRRTTKIKLIFQTFVKWLISNKPAAIQINVEKWKQPKLIISKITTDMNAPKTIILVLLFFSFLSFCKPRKRVIGDHHE